MLQSHQAVLMIILDRTHVHAAQLTWKGSGVAFQIPWRFKQTMKLCFLTKLCLFSTLTCHYQQQWKGVSVAVVGLQYFLCRQDRSEQGGGTFFSQFHWNSVSLVIESFPGFYTGRYFPAWLSLLLKASLFFSPVVNGLPLSLHLLESFNRSYTGKCIYMTCLNTGFALSYQPGSLPLWSERTRCYQWWYH